MFSELDLEIIKKEHNQNDYVSYVFKDYATKSVYRMLKLFKTVHKLDFEIKSYSLKNENDLKYNLFILKTQDYATYKKSIRLAPVYINFLAQQVSAIKQNLGNITCVDINGELLPLGFLPVAKVHHKQQQFKLITKLYEQNSKTHCKKVDENSFIVYSVSPSIIPQRTVSANLSITETKRKTIETIEELRYTNKDYGLWIEYLDECGATPTINYSQSKN